MKELINEMSYDLAECHVDYLDDAKLYTDYDTMAQKMVSRGYRKQSEWISVKDRLPTKEDADKYEHVLAITRDGRVRDWWYELVIFSSKNFTHWMPLPAPPEMKGGAE
jgi:hypothetical protein